MAIKEKNSCYGALLTHFFMKNKIKIKGEKLNKKPGTMEQRSMRYYSVKNRHKEKGVGRLVFTALIIILGISIIYNR